MIDDKLVTAWEIISFLNDPDSLLFIGSDRELFYKIAAFDSTLLYAGASDSLYINYFDSLSIKNTGTGATVTRLLFEELGDSAKYYNDFITEDNLPTENTKFVNEVSANMLVADPTETTQTALKDIANMHPFYGGEAVYRARGILHMTVIDNAEIVML